METLYFMVVAFVLPDPLALDRPLFVYYKPNFETYEQCHEFANKNSRIIYGRAAHHYQYSLTPEAIYCITGEQVKDINNNTWEEKKQI